MYAKQAAEFESRDKHGTAQNRMNGMGGMISGMMGGGALPI